MTLDEDAAAFAAATDLTAALRRREVSSRELLDLCLARIDRLNPALNAVVTLDTDRAREQAAAADEALAAGAPFGPLHGLPVTVKDTLETAGLRTTSGAPELAAHVPERDAEAVARLRSAGAVVFGKTNTATYAADAQTSNPVFGTTNNPWNTARTPGGSSGGPAAALAAGLTGLELASELSGSARYPAHCCGVFTLRPSYGLVPTRGNIPRAPGSLTSNDMVTLAPLARDARDLDLALDVLAGPTADRAVGWRLELPPPRAHTLDGFRIGVWLDDPGCPVDAQVAGVLQAAVEALRKAGARLSDVRPVDREAHDRLYDRLLHGAISLGLPQALYDRNRALADGLAEDDDSPRAGTLRAMTQSHRDWLAADEAREQQRARWAEFFRGHDVLLCPVAPVVAIPHDRNPDLSARRITVDGQPRPYGDLIRWTSPATAASLPAASVPVGTSADGLPVGLQVVGPHLEDRTVTRFAALLAELTGGFRRPPSASAAVAENGRTERTAHV
ncbi:amidase [Streptomyces boncukensis]|uniref:Amidase n=1 Tax=Streptomyces boncukensis TaxID=2711219 RepID=A0A6G4X0L2_9ACTN|nr:amidase [Streptomyces boncukensis]NGO70284.1 amidase [Streptomyces boncukensis]